MKKKCNWCKQEKDSDEFLDYGACSRECRESLNKEYDNYVDPSGFSRSKLSDRYN